MKHIQAMVSTAGSDNMPTEVKEQPQKKAPEENTAPYKQRQIENIFKCYGNCFFNPHEYTQTQNVNRTFIFKIFASVQISMQHEPAPGTVDLFSSRGSISLFLQLLQT